MTQDATEAEVLRNLIPELEDEGYEVFLQPRPPILPPFLKNFQPDAIAKRQDKQLLIEVVRSPGSSAELKELASLVQAHPGWELRVILATPTRQIGTLARQPPQSIKDAIAEVRRLYEAEHYGAALLLSWSTFEALARLLMFEDFQRPQSPGRLVQLLAQEGYLVPSDTDRLRKLSEKRNALIHGNLQTQINSSEIGEFLSVLEKLTSAALPA